MDFPGDVAPGEVIGGYRLERLIGSGSTSHVFLGVQVRVNRIAAVKVLADSLFDNKEVIDRMLREARVVNDIRHPNIIDILDFVETEDPPRVALVMEYIEGPSLKALRDRKLPFDQAIGIALQLVAAVDAAHKAGVIHRDIKPDNILLTKDPFLDPSKVPMLKVVDFGIAKLAGTSGKTATGIMLGTPAYMAPEQVAGRPPASPATDVFAIGEVLYELLSGTRAYPSAAIHETVRAKLRGDLPKLELPAMPGDKKLMALIVRCLSLKPQDRPGLEEVRDTLVDAQSERPAGPKTDPLSQFAPAVLGHAPMVDMVGPSSVQTEMMEQPILRPIPESDSSPTNPLLLAPTLAAPVLEFHRPQLEAEETEEVEEDLLGPLLPPDSGEHEATKHDDREMVKTGSLESPRPNDTGPVDVSAFRVVVPAQEVHPMSPADPPKPPPLQDMRQFLPTVASPLPQGFERSHPHGQVPAGLAREPRTTRNLLLVMAALLVIAFGLLIPMLLPLRASDDTAATPGKVIVSSNPSGARVEMADTRETLGRTPVEVDVPKDARVRKLRISSEGYRPMEIELTDTHPKIWVELEPLR